MQREEYLTVAKFKSSGRVEYFGTVTGVVLSFAPPRSFQSHEKEEESCSRSTGKELASSTLAEISEKGK
jgi:hypothetical protein